MIWVLVVLALVIGLVLGYEHKQLAEVLKRLKTLEDKPEPKPAVTLGSYRPANETKQTPGVITPKTPQQLEALAMERQRQEALGIGQR